MKYITIKAKMLERDLLANEWEPNKYRFSALIAHQMRGDEFNEIDSALAIMTDDHVRLDLKSCTPPKDENDLELDEDDFAFEVSITANYATPEDIYQTENVTCFYGYPVRIVYYDPSDDVSIWTYPASFWEIK